MTFHKAYANIFNMNKAGTQPNESSASKRRSTTFNDLMRGSGAAAMTGLGSMTMLDYPGIPAKIVGGAVAAYGMREQYKTVQESNGQEISRESFTMRMRQRVFAFARSLVDKTTGRADLSSRFKQRTAEEALSFDDREYRINFQRTMGGMAMLSLGFEIADKSPSTLGKAAGIVIGNIGLAEMIFNYDKTADRFNELSRVQSTAAESNLPNIIE